jgi:tripartite-type tricarboxylate transporter receptor subunit TctC
LGRQVVVENRAGAGTMIGNDFVAKSPPDGYTLLMAASAIAIQPALYKKMPYDAMRDFVPITQAVSVPSVIAVHPSVPAKSVKEMIALARAHPGELMYSSAGTGANSHLTLELFASMAKIRLVHVPYKGATPAMIDLIGGHVAIMSIPVSDALPQVRSGKLRALGVTSPKRISAAPEIPTIAEAGLPGYESVNWFGLLVPTGTAQEIIARLHKESVAVLRSPSVKERLDADSIDAVGNTPDEFAAFIKSETVKWAAVVKHAGITPE